MNQHPKSQLHRPSNPFALCQRLFCPCYMLNSLRKYRLFLSSTISHHPSCLSAARIPILHIPSLWGPYPRHSTSSSINAPSTRSGLWRMYASLPLAPWRRRVSEINIASESRALTKPHISKYFCFRLLLSSEARYYCAATASVPGIPSVEYIIKSAYSLDSAGGTCPFSPSPTYPGPLQTSDAGMSPYLS